MSTKRREQTPTDISRNLGLSDEVVDTLFGTDGLDDDCRDLFDRILIPLRLMSRDLQEGDSFEIKIRNLSNEAIQAAMILRATEPDVRSTADCFFRLGQFFERLRWIADTRYSEAIRAIRADNKRRSPLKQKAYKQKEAKRFAQNIARRLWDEDKSQSIRLADMCDRVWAALVQRTSQCPELYTPDDASGLKRWLREIAPEYARQGGRPKGKKEKP